MTDTLAGGPVPSSAPGATPPPLVSPHPDASAAIQSTLAAAPELANDPATAVSVAATGGTPIVAQSVVQAGKRQANAVAQNKVTASGGGGLFADIAHIGGDALHAVAHAANVGLATVQQEYRYLHDVEARHGMGAAFLEGAGILGAGIAGTVASGGNLDVGLLAGEGAARIEGALFYKDSWARAANPNYRDPHTGQLVSFGRDVTNALGIKGGEKTVMSGALDGLGDLIADPLALGGKVVAAQRTVSITAENVERAFNNPLSGFRPAVNDIAKVDSPGLIAQRYPQFKAIAGELAAAHTAEDVKDVFKDLAASNELLDAAKLPTLSPAHVPFRAIREGAANMARPGEGAISGLNGPVGTLATGVAKVISPRAWADRLAAVPGSTFSRDTMDITGTQINPADIRGVNDVMAMVRYSGSGRQAQAAGDAFVAATPAQRITIVQNAWFKMLFKLAGVDEPDVGLTDETGAYKDALSELVDGRTKKALLERFKTHMGNANIEGVGPDRVFGMRPDGDIVRPVVDEEGVATQAAIRMNQTGNISLPNITEARRMAQAISSGRTSRVLAGVDDFFYDHVTQGIFKPLVLMSGGYALHISLSELIPNTLRAGVGKSVGALYNRAIANLGYRAEETDKAGLLQWLYDVGGKRALANSDRAEYLAEMYAANGGIRTSLAGTSGEAIQGETNQAERLSFTGRQSAARMKTGSDFGRFDDNDEDFIKKWQASLHEAANDPWTLTAAKEYRAALARGEGPIQAAESARQKTADLLRTENPHVMDLYARAKYKTAGAPASWDAIDDHASALVQALQGDIHARPRGGELGLPNMDLLTDVINGRTPARHELEAMDPSLRPQAIKGRTLVPDGEGTVQRIANFGFRKILNPMVNIISRNQTYAIEYADAREALQPRVDAGLMTRDQAMTTAQAQATTHMMRFVHNLHDRTQWTATMRNWAPFYFAQEQAYRRMGRLLAEDPGAFRRYQLMISGVHDLAVNQQDSTGNKYIAFPGSGFLGKGVADLMGESGLSVGGVSPAAFGGSFSSANVIFPLSQGVKPDIGPMVIVPAMMLSGMFSELGKNYGAYRPVTNLLASDLADVAGQQAMSSGVLQQLIPNAFVGRLVEAFQGNDRAFNSSVMQAYQLADYQQAKATEDWIKGGRKGPAPQLIPPENATAQVRQQFQDKIRNMVRALYLARAITGMVSPVSSSVEMQNFGFPAKLNAAITKAGSVSQGMTQFILDNPDALPYTVAQSYVPSATDQTQKSGYSLASSQQGMDWVNSNQALLTKYGVGALWLMPQLTDSKYSPTVYNEQIAQGLRVKDTPDQFLNALYVAAGDNVYYAGLAIHEQRLAAMGNNAMAKNDEYNAWNQWVTTLEKQHPVWAEDHLSPTKQVNRMQTIQTLQAVYAAGDAPNTTQSSQVYQLLQNYQQAAAEFAAAGNQTSYSAQLSGQKAVQDAWIAYADNLETAVPSLKPIIQSVFKEALVVKT